MTELAGTPALARLIIRRDRIRLTVWIVAIVSIVAFSAQSILALYDDESELATYAETVGTNSAVIAISGPVHGLDTFGGRIAWEVWQFGVAIALMAVLTVVRHTRAEEEAGRTELVRAAMVGRHAHATAALAVAVTANAVIGGATTLSLVALDLPTRGSVTVGAAFAAVGVVFAAVGLLAAQITTHGRGANGIATAVLGATFVLRALGDTGNGVLSWLSPLGWIQATQPYAGDHSFPLALCVVAAVVVAAVAFRLERRRDVGAGLVADRPGPANATPRLGTPLGLAWRLHRASFAAWACGMFVGGLAFGSVVGSAEDLVSDNEAILDYLADIGGADLTDIFIATVLVYLALLAAGYGISAANRLPSEETAGRAELVLSTVVGRDRFAGSHLLVALAGSAAVLALSGLGMGIAHGLGTGAPGEIPRLAGAALTYLPSVWLFVGAASTLFGVAPRFGIALWGYLAFCAVVSSFGEVLGLPQVVRDLSPVEHAGSVPATGPAGIALAVVGLTALGLVLGGRAAYARRDVRSAT